MTVADTNGNPVDPVPVVYRPPRQQGMPVVSAFLAAIFAAAVFVAFAVFQISPVEPQAASANRVLAVAEPPPPVHEPPPPPEREPVEEIPRIEVRPEMRVVSPQLAPQQLDIRLVPDMGNPLAGDFQLDFKATGAAIARFEVFDPSEINGQPRALFVARPAYPASLSRSGISGRVVVRCVIDEQGLARNPTIHESTHRAFNAAALAAVGRSRFQAGTRHGKPVATWALIPFRFEAPAP